MLLLPSWHAICRAQRNRIAIDEYLQGPKYGTEELKKVNEKKTWLSAMLLCTCLGLAFLVSVQGLSADPNTRKINLAWDPNGEPDLDGYMIYYKCCIPGPPYDGTEADQGDSPIIVYLEDLQNPGNPRFELDGLSKQNDYYVTLTAFDSQSNQSGFSEEVFAAAIPATIITDPSSPADDSTDDRNSADVDSDQTDSADGSTDATTSSDGGSSSSTSDGNTDASTASDSGGGGGCFIQTAAPRLCIR